MGGPARWMLLVGWLWIAACASTPPALPDPPEWNDARRATADALAARLREVPGPGDALSIRLAFPAGVDLDLYVTDPLLETVYYANTPIASGGRLEQDRRCADPAPGDTRIELVRFDAPLPGRYRVGVDFQHRCGEGPDEVPYALAIQHGRGREELVGLARWLEFTTIVHEFDVEGTSPAAPARAR